MRFSLIADYAARALLLSLHYFFFLTPLLTPLCRRCRYAMPLCACHAIAAIESLLAGDVCHAMLIDYATRHAARFCR